MTFAAALIYAIMKLLMFCRIWDAVYLSDCLSICPSEGDRDRVFSSLLLFSSFFWFCTFYQCFILKILFHSIFFKTFRISFKSIPHPFFFFTKVCVKPSGIPGEVSHVFFFLCFSTSTFSIFLIKFSVFKNP